jgi:hypothetical protein
MRTLICVLTAMLPATLGCATLFSPGPDMVPVRSNPSGATVYLDGAESGRTPCVITVPRSSEGIFKFELAGYEPVTIDRDKVVNGMTCVNLGWILVWPVVPVAYAVDLVSGDVGKYSTKPIIVELKPVKGKAPPPEPLPTDIP